MTSTRRGETKPLSQCRPGVTGVVLHLEDRGGLSQRLMEMGLLPGAEIRVVRVAPLGDPIEIEIHHYLLSLRKSEASGVQVEVRPKKAEHPHPAAKKK